MAATTYQLNSYVYYVGSYGPKRGMITGTHSKLSEDQEDTYLIEGEGAKLFAESVIFDDKADCLTFFETQLNALP